MNAWEIAFFVACGVVVLLCVMFLFVVHLARQAQTAKAAQVAAVTADAATQIQQSMQEAQMNAAPTDVALDQSLKDGTF